MSIPAKFMEIARGKLDGDIYNAIYERAVALERKVMQTPVPPPVNKPVLVERVAAHLNGEAKPVETPHILERLERRMDIDVTAADLGDLLKTALAGGPNVSVIKQTMDLVQECVVHWRGKHFVVVFSKSRGKLITAYAKPAKRRQKVKVGRPRDWREEATSVQF